MAYTPSFYSQKDQNIYSNLNSQFLGESRFRGNVAPVPTNDENSVEPDGILSASVVNNSGNKFSATGNMFGQGTTVKPVFGNSYIDTVRREGPNSFAAYNKLSQAGGNAPAGMYQTDYFPGTQNELVDAMGRTVGQPGYSPNMDMSENAFQKAEDKRGFLSKLMNNAKQKMTDLPAWAKTGMTALGMINPFTAIPKILGINTGNGGPSYGIAGLSDRQKAMYDNLASNNMLFNDNGIMKTYDGKNFSRFNDESIDKYFDSKTNRFGSIEEYEKYLAKDPDQRKNLLKTLQFYKQARKGDDNFVDFTSNNITDSTVTSNLVDEFNTTTTNNDGPGYTVPTAPPGTYYTNTFSGGDPSQDNDRGSPNSGDQDGGASADAQSDDAAGAGGYRRGGRIGYYFGGLAARGMKR